MLVRDGLLPFPEHQGVWLKVTNSSVGVVTPLTGYRDVAVGNSVPVVHVGILEVTLTV